MNAAGRIKQAFSASLFVRRPILALVLNALIVVAGLAAFRGIEVRELPSVDRPVITVRTQLDGAAPETMDREVTETIEGAVARVTVPGIGRMGMTDTGGGSAAKSRSARPSGHGASW